MTSTQTPPLTRPITPALTGQLALWLSLQLLVLTASAIGLRWSAGDAPPAGLDALPLLLIAQVISSTLLFKAFCNTPILSIVTAATAWPFIIAAAYLSAVQWSAAAVSGLYLSGWILTLGLIYLKVAPLLTTVPALLAMLVLGGPMLAYLRLEFTGRETTFFGPISDLLRLSTGEGSVWNTLLPIWLCAIALLFPVLKR